ncbi:MAG: DUF4303 domain-containing protein [Myxococcota bacterium]
MNTIDELRQALAALLPGALRKLVARIREGEARGIYSFVLYPSSGFRDIGTAFSSRRTLAEAYEKGQALNAELEAMMKEHPDLQLNDLSYTSSEAYYEVNACEWHFISLFQEELAEVNRTIDRVYSLLQDQGVDSATINSTFEELSVEAIKRLKSEGAFSAPTFEDDVLLGVQFPDSSDQELVVRVSAILNSPAWHTKIIQNSKEVDE